MRSLSDTIGRLTAVRNWPSISVWHGATDHIVDASNGDAILAQWLGVHGIAGVPDTEDRIDGYSHRLWRSAEGRVAMKSQSLRPGISPGRTSGRNPNATPRAKPAAANDQGTAALVTAGVGKVIEDALRAAGLMR